MKENKENIENWQEIMASINMLREDFEKAIGLFERVKIEIYGRRAKNIAYNKDYVLQRFISLQDNLTKAQYSLACIPDIKFKDKL